MLERWHRDGRLSGAIETAFEDLATDGPHVCGMVEGALACFRDRHEDLACPEEPFEPRVQVVAAPPPGRADGWVISGTCGQHCIRLGCDGPERCLDPCRPGERPTLSARPLRRTEVARGPRRRSGHATSSEHTPELLFKTNVP